MMFLTFLVCTTLSLHWLQEGETEVGCPPGFYRDSTFGGCTPSFAEGETEVGCPPGFYRDSTFGGCTPSFAETGGETEVGKIVNIGAFSVLNQIKNSYVCSKKDCVSQCRKDNDLISAHRGEYWCNVKIDQDCTDQKYNIVRGHYSYIACSSTVDEPETEETDETEVGKLINLGGFSIINSIKNSYVCSKKDCVSQCRRDNDLVSAHRGEYWCNVKINQDCTDQKYNIVRGHYSYIACSSTDNTAKPEPVAPATTAKPKPKKKAKSKPQTTAKPKPIYPYRCYAYRKGQDDDWCKTAGGQFTYTGGQNENFPGCGHCVCCQARTKEADESEVGKLVNLGGFSIINSIKNSYVCSKKDCVSQCRKDNDLISAHRGEYWCNVKIDQDCTDQKYNIVRGHYSYLACSSTVDTQRPKAALEGSLAYAQPASHHHNWLTYGFAAIGVGFLLYGAGNFYLKA